jgi:4-hydroxy-tetrahydrodipicolinate synthase
MPQLGTVVTALVTPFDAQGRVDEEAAARLLHHLVDHGSDGFVICGTTGEAPTLTDEEHLRMVELAVGELGGRVPIIAGTGSNDTRHAIHLTERATELGADAMLVVAPYYNKPNRRGLLRHFAEVARATDKPIVLYNIPGRSVIDMPNDLLAELAQIPNVTAVKQANRNNLAIVEGLDLYAGDDDIFCDTLELGGAGVISVCSHIVSDDMRRIADEPDPARRRELDAELHHVYESLGVTTNPIPIKAALNLLGFEVGGHRLPLVEPDEHERAVVKAMLERHGLLEAAAT